MRSITTVDIQGNLFEELPEELLWGLPNLVMFFARSMKLRTVPEQFFAKNPRLVGL